MERFRGKEEWICRLVCAFTVIIIKAETGATLFECGENRCFSPPGKNQKLKCPQAPQRCYSVTLKRGKEGKTKVRIVLCLKRGERCLLCASALYLIAMEFYGRCSAADSISVPFPRVPCLCEAQQRCTAAWLLRRAGCAVRDLGVEFKKQCIAV